MALLLERLRAEDIPLLRPLVVYDGHRYSEEHARAFMENSDHLAFVAKLDGKAIGLLYGYKLTRMDDLPPQFFVYSVDIHPEYQDRGYGTKLFQYAVDYARENGFSECFVLTEKSNRRACRVYEKAGGVAAAEDCVEYDIVFNSREKRWGTRHVDACASRAKAPPGILGLCARVQARGR